MHLCVRVCLVSKKMTWGTNKNIIILTDVYIHIFIHTYTTNPVDKTGYRSENGDIQWEELSKNPKYFFYNLRFDKIIIYTPPKNS